MVTPLQSIIILDSFKTTPPAQRKIDKKRDYYKQFGELPADIVINEDNVLIDGYSTYITALEYGFVNVPVRVGAVEVIEAYHHAGQQLYKWAVPQHLIGKIKIGDKCTVRTSRGIRRVRVAAVLQQTLPEDNLKRVVSVHSKANQ